VGARYWRAVSQANVEIVRRTVEAWNADDLDAALAEIHADVEWHPSLEPALEGKGTTYKGHEGARRAWAEYRGEAFERLTAQIEEIRDLGESVLVLGHFVVIARTTHIEFDTEVGLLMTFRDGKIATSHDYLSHQRALEAAGLRE
jgi:ketosteroid isomerase-like protein